MREAGETYKKLRLLREAKLMAIRGACKLWKVCQKGRWVDSIWKFPQGYIADKGHIPSVANPPRYIDERF